MITRPEIWCTCGHCKQTFKVIDLPEMITVAASAMLAARCTNCDTQPPKLFLAHESEIKSAQARQQVAA